MTERAPPWRVVSEKSGGTNMNEGKKDMNNAILDVLKSLIPVRLEAVWGAIIGVPAAVSSYFFGEWNSALEALLVLIFPKENISLSRRKEEKVMAYLSKLEVHLATT